MSTHEPLHWASDRRNLKRGGLPRLSAVLALTALAVCSLVAAGAQSGPPTSDAQYRAIPNLIQNPSFEMDWMHNLVTTRTRFLLLDQSDWGYAQGDGQPDCWVLPESARLDTSAARFGRASLRLDGTAWQVVYLCGETDPRAGGAYYSPFRPLPAQLQRQEALGPFRFGAWCKTAFAWEAPSLSVTMEYSAGEKITRQTQTAAFTNGTHGWEYREVVFPASPGVGIAHAATVKLIHNGRGAAWFDGAVGVEDVRNPAPNLLPGAAFLPDRGQTLKPVLWTWSRSDYYRFTGWSHGNGAMAGGVEIVPAGRSGGQAVQFNLLPGDNLAVKSRPVILNQSTPRPLRIGAWIWADDLRWMEIMAQDEQGQWVPQEDFAGVHGTDQQYRNRLIGSGTHDWEYVSKWLAPRKPLKQVTIWLCARGFDGALMNRYVVGTVRFDGVTLSEPGTSRADLAQRHVRIPEVASPLPPGIAVTSVDAGERLWGTNTLRVAARNNTARAQTLGPGISLQAPGGGVVKLEGEPVTVAPGREGVFVARYRLLKMCGPMQRYTLAGPERMIFSTPPSPLSLRIDSVCVYPDESLQVGINLNVARASLPEVGSCRIVVKYPGGERSVRDLSSVGAAFWRTDQPRPPMLVQGYVGVTNLIPVSIDRVGLPIHSADDPVRDCRVVVTLMDRSGSAIASQTSEPFGFVERPRVGGPAEPIRRTTVGTGGVLRVNGAPYVFNSFPTAATDLGGVGSLHNFPKSWKIKAIPFPKSLVFGPDEEADWKRQVIAFVEQNRTDPMLFGWQFRHDGEITFWNSQWPKTAECERKAASWVRATDSDHVIMGAEWLLGHRALNDETARAFGFLDVLGVEMGLSWIPDAEAARKSAGRSLTVMAGLECYYTQSADLMRWRAYEALRHGVNGIGICPSGMLVARPELVSFLRVLYAETEALRPMLAGTAPADLSRCSDAGVSLWERKTSAGRYLVAIRGPGPASARVPVRFAVPTRASRAEVLFEGRTLVIRNGAFTDSLDRPNTVHVYKIGE